MTETGESSVFDNKNIDFIKKNSHPEDFKKYQDFLYLNKENLGIF